MTQRSFHTDSRAGENFTKNGLETLTGQPARKWGRYVVKELVDNALEAAETTDDPAVSVSMSFAGTAARQYVESVSVTDNGPGFTESQLEQITDVERFGGTKRHYALPSRGTQGNALMTLLGIQHLADGGPFTIETRGWTYKFHVDEATVDSVPTVSLEKAVPITATDGGSGTTVSMEFGDTGQRWARLRSILETLNGFAALNPHVRFEILDRESTAAADTTTRYEPKGSAVGGRALWYDRSAFIERVSADIRTDTDLTVSEFVGEFDGLSSRSKRETVAADAGIESDVTLSAALLNDGSSLDTPVVERLHKAMKDATSPRSADNLHNTLGSVGDALERGPRTLLEHYDVIEADIEGLVADLQADGADVSDWRDLSTYYRASDAVETDEHRMPFVFELATIALPPEMKDRGVRMNFGINGSVSYSSPNATVKYEDRSKQRSARSISGAFNSLKHSFVIVSNLMCPNIPFQDKGKQQFPTEPFEETISDVVGKTIRKYQRDIRPPLNALEKSDEPEQPTLPASEKAPQGFIKETVFDLLEPVYNKATENGTYSIMMRQLFYELRPRFHTVAEHEGYKYNSRASVDNPKPLELNYDTFTGYVDEYEEKELGERIVRRDDRGFFVEPHSNERIELSTQRVAQYDPGEAVSTEYDTLLFVEKTGFYEQLHRDFEITKRYDIGLINAQGYSTTAIRNFVEKVKRADGTVQYLTLTDLDVGGLGIATDADSPDALSALSSFDATRLGVTVDDVERFELDVETVNYSDKDRTKLRNHYEDGDIEESAYKFLSDGQRVEINAFAPTELKEFVETKLDELGVSKIEPDADAVETPDIENWEDRQRRAVKNEIGRYVSDQVDTDLIDALADQDDAIALPDDDDRPEASTEPEAVRDQVVDKLGDQPSKPWPDVNDEVSDEIAEPVEDEQDDYVETVENAVAEILENTDLVSVDPDVVTD